MEYKERNYRDFTTGEDLYSFKTCIGESDLFIKANRNLPLLAEKLLTKCRNEIINYIRMNPFFKISLTSLEDNKDAPRIVRSMIKAAKLCNVGPMAAVAGAIAESVGIGLLKYSSEVVIENGGDIFIKSDHLKKVSIFAGNSPLSQKIFLNIDSRNHPLGVCTSSGTVGPSLSFGNADAVTIISKSTALADAAATSIGNRIKNIDDINLGLKCAQNFSGVIGAVIIKGDKIGFWGDIDFGIIR